jgi:thioredoxin reductase (NADPH)
MGDRVEAHEKIQIHWNTVPVEVLADDDGNMRAARIKDTLTGEERELESKGFFIAIGHIPNTGPFANELETDHNGYFIPQSGSQVKTKVPGVYVAGDCADHVYRQAITAAGMGCQAAIDAERWLAEQE